MDKVDTETLSLDVDSLDEAFVRLVSKRARLIKDATPYSPEKEAAALKRLLDLAHALHSPISDADLTTLYRNLRGACETLGHKVRVSYLGPRGTYTEMAVIRAFGETIDMMPTPSIDEAVRLVESEGADFAVVPIENSSQGTVTRTLDLLMKTPLRITGEVYVKVSHCLMTKTGSMHGIETITAHPQALSQCHQWLSHNFPNIKTVPSSSNAQAAKEASENTTVAAIAASRAATIYDLKIVQKAIEDNPCNQTRFIVLGHKCQKAGTSPRMKTSLVFSVANKAGALFDALASLKKYSVSMAKLESRPSNNGAWEYNFYVDIEGHADDETVKNALTEMSLYTSFMKNLGSYPEAEEKIF